jgi:hypothetical protein
MDIWAKYSPVTRQPNETDFKPANRAQSTTDWRLRARNPVYRGRQMPVNMELIDKFVRQALIAELFSSIDCKFPANHLDFTRFLTNFATLVIFASRRLRTRLSDFPECNFHVCSAAILG